MGWLLPWRRRAQRKADVAQALEQAARSRRAARRAERLAADLREIQSDELARAILESLGGEE